MTGAEAVGGARRCENALDPVRGLARSEADCAGGNKRLKRTLRVKRATKEWPIKS